MNAEELDPDNVHHEPSEGKNLTILESVKILHKFQTYYYCQLLSFYNIDSANLIYIMYFSLGQIRHL